MRILLIALVLITSGCMTMDQNTLISPSESIYYQANQFYDAEIFDLAIELYEQFLETKPRSRLAISAKLNLGMSYFHVQNYKQAYFTLNDVETKDENIDLYIGDILKICKVKAKDEIETEEKSQEVASADTAGAGEIEITVLDAYIDDFGSVVLKGKTDRKATVIVDDKEIDLDADNIFTASLSWKKGDPILITAKDASRNSGELSFFPDGERPDAPRGLRTVNITSNGIEIEWDENDEEDVKGYRLFWNLKGGGLHELQELIPETKYDIVGLQSAVEGSNRTFEFYIRAVDKMNNESDDSDILEATLP